MRFVDAVECAGPRDWSVEWKDRASAACFASHLEAMRLVIAEPSTSVTGAIVCEDDVLLHNEFSERCDSVLKNLPTDAPFCSLGYLVRHWDAGLQWAGRATDCHNLCPWVPEALTGAHLYWITPTYARAVLEQYGSIPTAELPTRIECIFELADGFASYAPLGLQDTIESTIRPPHELDFHLSGQSAWRYRDYSDCEQGQHRSPLQHQDGLPPPTIALCMIVRDEAPVIGRCLESVLPLIDSWQICDTGSCDSTREIIASTLGHLPGQLHERPWRDFGWNRTELMTLATGSADYLLLLDADMTLDWRGPLPPLQADAYLLRHAGELAYAIPRLVRGSRRWHYEGSTHEYLACDGQYDQTVLEALVVEHHADGGRRADKFARDATLLERDIARRPDDVRATFYLAQTYRDLGEDVRAIELYKRRAALGGWDEEVFYSVYQAGVLLARHDDDRATDMLLAAWQSRPHRAEPLYELVRLLRYRGLHRTAHRYARQAVEIPYPDDLLFVHRWIYDWGLRFELAVASYWVGDVDTALTLSQALLAEARLPGEVEAAVRENISYCLAAGASDAQPVRDGPRTTARLHGPTLLKHLCPSFEHRPLELDVSPQWPQFNPTIAPDEDGFRVIVRTANYRLIDGSYHFLTDEGTIRTINHCARLDRRLELVGAEVLTDRSSYPPLYPSRVHGYEDCRLVRLGTAWAATATVRDRNPVERCETALLLLDGAEITGIRILNSPWPGRHEKNWMPFSVDDSLHVLYSCGPTVVLRYDTTTGAP
jgi:glycosyltransferase involved in cell wall biosynthesis